MLAKLRAKASFRRPSSGFLSRSHRSQAPSPPPPPPPPPPPLPTEEELAATIEEAKSRQELADENLARDLANRLLVEQFERELANERIARELEEGERQRQRQEEEATAAEVTRLELENIEAELRRTNGVFECPICAEEYFRGETLVACTDGHMLCTSCARLGSSAAFSNLDPRLRCLADSSCEATYLAEERVKFLDDGQLDQLEKIRMEKDLASLMGQLEDGGGLLKCPFCPYAVVYDDHDQLTTLDCLNPDCAKRSCLACKHVDHTPLPCALAHPTAIHKLEEEMSNALIRRCGKCQVVFVKTDGCNLITCAACSTKSCYLCRSLVTGYKHFDEAGECKGKLFDDKVVKKNVEAARQRGLATLETAEEKAHAQKLAVK
ncbi:hypothetical protein JCM11251_000666 [Rhodosporidiobolus azoricus]